MTTAGHALDRRLLTLITSGQWKNEKGKLQIEAHIHDYLAGLTTDLEEEGLPGNLAYCTVLKETLTVGMSGYGRAKVAELVSKQINELLSDAELPA